MGGKPHCTKPRRKMDVSPEGGSQLTRKRTGTRNANGSAFNHTCSDERFTFWGGSERNLKTKNTGTIRSEGKGGNSTKRDKKRRNVAEVVAAVHTAKGYSKKKRGGRNQQ